MKTKLIALFALLSTGLFAQNWTKHFFKQTDLFMNLYVHDGLVDYELLSKNSMQLDSLVEQLEQANLNELTTAEKKAFYINAYNLLTVKNVLNHYPINSPLDVGGFFKTIKHNLAGEKITLDALENKIIRPTFKDPRIHFALVCAGKGCPPIVSEAYIPEQIEEQLNRQTKLAINDPNFIRVDHATKEVNISEIFKWYGGDFKTTSTKNVNEFINSHLAKPFTKDYKVGFYDYDWSLNKWINPEAGLIDATSNSGSVIQTYTPSKLLKKGQVELQYFQNIYTQTAFRDNTRTKVDLNSRSTYYGGLFYALFGVSDNGRLNVGFDVNIKSVHNNPDKNSSFFEVLKFGKDQNTRTEVASVGPKIKWVPFKKRSISIQSAFWVPIANEMEGNPWLDYDRYTWWNQLFYDKSIGSKYQLFLEADLLFRFGKGKKAYTSGVNKQSQLSVPLSAFFSYFPTGKSTLYTMIQFAPTGNLNKFQGNDLSPGLEYAQDYAQAGLGAKYQVSSQLSLELLYSNFFASLNGGAGQTYNLGLRFLR